MLIITSIYKFSELPGKYMKSVVNGCLRSLKILDLSGCFQIDDDALVDVLNRCESLTYLDVENCRKLSDRCIDALINSKRRLEAINIGGDYNITPQGLSRFINRYSGLEDVKVLHISGLCINDEIIYGIIKRCVSLTVLGISYADISETALSALLDKFGSQLEKLNLSWLGNMTPNVHGVIHGGTLSDMISSKCPKLTELDISGIKTVHLPNISNLLDFKIQQVTKLILSLYCVNNFFFAYLKT